MLSYILEVHICWVIFYLFYRFGMRSGNYFFVHRWYLLSSLILGLLLPLMQYAQVAAQISEPFFVSIIPVEIWAEEANKVSGGFFTVTTLWYLYWIGAFVLMGRLFAGMTRLYGLYATGKKSRFHGVHIVASNEVLQPFSFFRTMFIHPETLNNEHYRKYIILHEKTHIRSWHSLDIIFSEILAIFFWYSPLVWLFQKELKDVHEYEADAAVLRHSEPMEYGKVLLNFTSKSSFMHVLGSPFFGSRIKRRFKKMAEQRTLEQPILRYLMLIPLLLFMVFALSFSRNALASPTKSGNDELIKEVNFEPTDWGSTEINNRRNSADTIPPKGKVKEVELINEERNDPNNDDVFTRVDQMPSFGSSDKELLDYLSSSIIYPEKARIDSIQGTVVVQFIVDENGKINDPVVVRSVSSDLDNETLRAMREMPDWKPGTQDGKPVKVRYTLPVRFRVE
jgi:TonB family protein